MNPSQGRMPINPQQIEQALKLVEAKVTLHEQRLATYQENGKAWRALVERQWSTSQFIPISSTAERLLEPGTVVSIDEFKRWRDAHKSMEEAEVQLMGIAIAELKSQATIYKAMLSEAADDSKTRILRPDRRM